MVRGKGTDEWIYRFLRCTMIQRDLGSLILNPDHTKGMHPCGVEYSWSQYNKRKQGRCKNVTEEEQ